MNFDVLKDFPFHYHIKTRWKDMDSFGHVNNGIFLTYIEDARTSFFNRWNINEQNKSLIVASIKIDFISQIQHPSNLIIGQKLSRIGKSSFDIQSSIYLQNSNNPSASAVVTCVCYDYEKKKSVPVYKRIKSDYSSSL